MLVPAEEAFSMWRPNGSYAKVKLAYLTTVEVAATPYHTPSLRHS
jgi:hypothetical protein